MCYVPSRDGFKVGIVLAGPYISEGSFVAYDVFVDSVQETYAANSIRKRR